MKSPCKNDCYLNNNDICLGCGRNSNEINAWMSMSDEERDLAMAKAEVRLKTVIWGDEDDNA